MTLSTTTTRVQYDGNGSTKAFSVPYKFLSDSDLVVVLTSSAGVDTTQTITTHYTVTNSGNGGTVTMVTAPASGETLTISRVVSLTQETDYIEGDDFPAETHEAALDKLTMIAQQHDDTLNRAITVPRTVATTFDGELTPVASKIIGFNSAADAFQLFTPQDAGINDAANVAYTRNVTGATVRTVQTTIDEYALSPMDFGAAGDGTTDDYDALVACYTAAISSGKDVSLGGRTYYTTLQVRLTGPVRTFGPGRVHRYIDHPASACSGLSITYGAFGILGYFTDLPNAFPNLSKMSSSYGIDMDTCAANTSGVDIQDAIIDIEAVNYGDKTVTCAVAGAFDSVAAGEHMFLIEGRGTGAGGNSYLSGRQWICQVESRAGDVLTLTRPVLRDLDGRSFPASVSIPTSEASNGFDYRLYAIRATLVEGVEFHNMSIKLTFSAAAEAVAFQYVNCFFAKDAVFSNVSFETEEPTTAGRQVADMQIGDSVNVSFHHCRADLGIGPTSFNRCEGGGIFHSWFPNVSDSPMEQGEGGYNQRFIGNVFLARASSTGDYGIWLGNSLGTVFSKNLCIGSFTEDTWGVPTGGAALQHDDAHDCIVSENAFFGFLYGINHPAAPTKEFPDYYSRRLQITGNLFVAPPGVTTGSRGMSGMDIARDCLIANNRFENFHQPRSGDAYKWSLHGNRMFGNKFNNRDVAIDATGGGPGRYQMLLNGGSIGRFYMIDVDVTPESLTAAKFTLDADEGYTYRWTFAANKSLGRVCTAAGTVGTLNSGSTTGGISTGTDILTVNDATDLYVGCRIDIAGVTSPSGGFVVEWINGTEIKLDANADATVAGAAVSYHAPTLITLPTACDYLADLNQTISGTYTQSEVQAISDKVDALLALMRASGVMDAS